MKNPRTVNEVIADFKGRRAGIIKALTQDLDLFYQRCDPTNPSPLRLLGFPYQHWQVSPVLTSFSELPEPKQGINHVRDTMTKEEWLRMVGLHSQTWLHSLTAYFADKCDFDKAEKESLFVRIGAFAPIHNLIIGGRKRKRVDIDEGRELPEEMVSHILSGLPARDVVRCKTVCKLWYKLTGEPKFVISHLNNYYYKSKSNHQDYLMVIEQPVIGSERFFVRRSDGTSSFRHNIMEVDSPFPNKKQQSSSRYEVLGCVNGVMLVKRQSRRRSKVIGRRSTPIIYIDDIVLWNPSINRHVRSISSSIHSPILLTTIPKYNFFVLGLGFDGKDHKVVAISFDNQLETKEVYLDGGCRGIGPGSVQVYTVANDSWSNKTRIHLPPSWSPGKELFYKGAIHWTNLGPNINDKHDIMYAKDSYVVAFDVKQEVFKYFKLPVLAHTRPVASMFPTVLDGSFAMFYNSYKSCEIWVMGEYGVPHSWSKHYAFNLCIDEVLHFKSNGELLFTTFTCEQLRVKLDVYNVKTNSQKTLTLNKRGMRYTVCSYTESLVLA